MAHRRGTAVAALLAAASLSGAALAATHHGAARPPAKKAPVVNQHLGRHHCHLSSGAGTAPNV